MNAQSLQTSSETRRPPQGEPAPLPPPGVHPLAGTPMSGAEIVVQVLADEGADVLFGYSGGAILPVYDAVFRYNAEHPREDDRDAMPLIVPANEQGAGFMAAGYARASGKVGVAVVTSGPGATNTVTPVRDSMADSIPMVVICGQVPTAAIGSDAFQEAPISSIMSACAKHVFLVTDPARLESTLRTAFELARSGRPGPVVVDIPKDVQNAALTFQGEGQLAIPGYRARMRAVEQAHLTDTDCAAFFAALGQARRPLIYAGGGIIAAEAAEALRAFAEAFGLPVTTTLMGIGAVDTTSPLALHMLGMHGTAYANYAVEDCDFVLALGARFDDRVAGVPGKFAPRARFIAQVDIDPAEIGKVKAVQWHHCSPIWCKWCCSDSRSSDSTGSASSRRRRWVMACAVFRKAARLWSSSPSTWEGSGKPQCAVTGAPGQYGQASPAALSQTVMTKSIFGGSGAANTSQLLLA